LWKKCIVTPLVQTQVKLNAPKVRGGIIYLTTLKIVKRVKIVNIRLIERLQEFRELVKEVVRSACRTALLEAGFTPDDYYIDQGTESPDLMGETGRESSFLMPSSYDMDIYGEAPDKMTYTEQANKRAHCKRLTWYVF
jgi:hypothetical protein